MSILAVFVGAVIMALMVSCNYTLGWGNGGGVEGILLMVIFMIGLVIWYAGTFGFSICSTQS